MIRKQVPLFIRRRAIMSNANVHKHIAVVNSYMYYIRSTIQARLISDFLANRHQVRCTYLSPCMIVSWLHF